MSDMQDTTVKRSFDPWRGLNPQVENHYISVFNVIET